jgi:predicted aldo/keto reductase-like oxidoreductase
MDKRRFGRTEHMSTLAVFGAFSLAHLDQPQADQVVQQMINAGINHIDVAPTYGDAELRLGPWMPSIRENFFLGCKTTERTKAGLTQECHESLERLRVDQFDLYQLHAVTTIAELDRCTKKGGALEGALEMRDQGLTHFIGITGHGMQTPKVFIEALSRFDFDSVLFPIYPALFSDAEYQAEALALLDLCEDKDVGVMTIKAIAKEPWGNRVPTHHTGYLPFEEKEAIQRNINFVLSHKLTLICTSGAYRILDKIYEACENFEPMSEEEHQALIKKHANFDLIF